MSRPRFVLFVALVGVPAPVTKIKLVFGGKWKRGIRLDRRDEAPNRSENSDWLGFRRANRDWFSRKNSFTFGKHLMIHVQARV